MVYRVFGNPAASSVIREVRILAFKWSVNWKKIANSTHIFRVPTHIFESWFELFALVERWKTTTRILSGGGGRWISLAEWMGHHIYIGNKRLRVLMTIAAEEYNIVLSAGPWLFISRRYCMSTTGFAQARANNWKKNSVKSIVRILLYEPLRRCNIVIFKTFVYK